MPSVEQVSVATVATGHFDFIATGPSPEAATGALLAAWKVHAASTGADLDLIGRDDVNVVTGPLGSVFRDGSALPYTEEQAQALHDARRDADDQHDPGSCWCCCMDCNFDTKAIMAVASPRPDATATARERARDTIG